MADSSQNISYWTKNKSDKFEYRKLGVIIQSYGNDILSGILEESLFRELFEIRNLVVRKAKFWSYMTF